MPLEPGTRLGPYEILAPIGAGGMGEVYRARDTRLDRSVAVKVLPGEAVSQPDRRERFEREARAVSGLSHPHICALYDVGTHEGTDFLVMEHLEGETLEDRLARGPLPAEQVLRRGVEIARALAEAHRHGVVHRDLKPGNVMLTKSGAKLLDFGLAKILAGEIGPAGMQAGPGAMTSAPTEKRTLTAEGTLLGTLQYMAPEQLEGREADARTDIFAFGSLLHEMATGQRAFTGRSQASLIAAILDQEPPPISSAQPLAPPALDRLVKRCLAKDPDDRWQSAADIAAEIAWIAEGGSQSDVPVPAAGRTMRAGRTAWTLFGLAAGILIGLAAGWALSGTGAPPSPVAPTVRFHVQPPAGARIALEGIAISPDGRTLVFTARKADSVSLYRRRLDRDEAEPIAGTEGAGSPFFSPDGRWVGYAGRSRLWKIPIDGGTPVAICEARDPQGAAWGADGMIWFVPDWVSGLQRVSESGGTPETVALPDLKAGERGFLWPEMLPGGEALLLTVWIGGSLEESRIVIQPIGGGERRTVVEKGIYARYASTGHVLYVRGGALFTLPFDAERLEATGPPTPAGEGILTQMGNGHAMYAISADGSLAFIPGGPTTPKRRLVWMNREGRSRAAVEPVRGYSGVQLSPDGRKVVLTIEESTYDIWVQDLDRGTLTRLTFTADEISPVWTPDGRQIIFSTTPASSYNLFRVAADGSGSPERLTESDSSQIAYSVSPDGRFLSFTERNLETANDLWVLPLNDPSAARPFLKTPFDEGGGIFSPDGRWIAYESAETGRHEVYVQPWPGPGGKWQISSSGGAAPLWSPSGRELFFWQDESFMAVEIAGGPTFSAGRPRKLFEAARRSDRYDISPDGKEFLLNLGVEDESRAPEVELVVGWAGALAARSEAPAR